MTAEVKPEAAAPEKSSTEINLGHLRKKTEMLEQELNKRDALLQQQQQALEQLQSRMHPERDEFDSIPADELMDKAKMMRLLEKERSKILSEAEKIAVNAYQKYEKDNFQSRLKTAYPDYEAVVTQENAERLQEKDPEFYEALSEIKDDYRRREFAYKRMKKLAEDSKPKVKAQDVIEENRKTSGNYYAPQGQSATSNPYGFEFDIKNPEAKRQAYEKLKAAQKRSF